MYHLRWFLALGTAVILTAPLSSPAFVSGDSMPPVETIYNVTFRTSGQSMWGPGATSGPTDTSVSILSTSWDKSGGVEDVVDVADYDFGGGMHGSTSGNIAVDGRFRDVGPGSVSVTYPVQVKLTTPGANSFKPGDTITIGSAVTLMPDWDLTTSGFTGKVDVDVDFALAAAAGGKVCAFSCADFNFFPEFDASTSGTLITAEDTEPTEISSAEKYVHGISGFYGLPNVQTTDSLWADGVSLEARGSHKFIDIEVDLDAWLKYIGLVIPLGAHIDISGAKAGYETIDVDVDVEMTQAQEFKFTPTVEVSLPLPRAVQYTVKNESGAVVASGSSALVKFDAGQSVDIVYPATATDIFNVTPTFSLRNTFSNNTVTQFAQGAHIDVLELTLKIPGFEVIPEVCFPEVCVWTPFGDVCTPSYCTPAVNSPEIDLGTLGPLFSQETAPCMPGDPFSHYQPGGLPELPCSKTDTYTFDQDRGPWQLGGFNTESGDSFPLDPQLPPTACLAVPDQVDEGQVATMDGSCSFDPDGDPLTYSWTFGDGGSAVGDEVTHVTVTHIYGDNGNYTVTLTVKDICDICDGEDTATATITVNNVAPTAHIDSVEQPNPHFILPVVHTLTFNGTFTDPGWLDTHTATWDFGDGTIVIGEVIEENEKPDSTGSSTAAHAYLDPGVYSVTLTVTDDDGDTGKATTTVAVMSAEEANHSINDYIQRLPSDAFDGQATQRKNALGNKFAAVDHMLDAGNYKGAIQKLQNDIRAKADGGVDGKIKDDWIIAPAVQKEICLMIDDLIAYLETLL